MKVARRAIGKEPRVERVYRGGILLILACFSGCAAPRLAPGDIESLQRIQRLEELRPAGAEAGLAEILATASPVERRRAARALGRIGSAAAATPLCAALGDTHLEVRTEVAFALSQLQDPGAKIQALGALLPMLRSPAAPFRRRLVEAIGKLGVMEHAQAILPMLSDSEAVVRAEAALALHRMRARSLAPGGSVDTASSAAASSETTDQKIVAALIRAVEREDVARARWKMIYALAAMRDAAAIETFVTALRSSELWERFFAVRGIAEAVRAGVVEADGLERLQRLLITRLDDADPRIAIEAALALGDPSPSGRNASPAGTAAPFDTRIALDALAAKLDDDDAALVTACAQAIGHYRSLESVANNALNLAVSSTKVRIRAAAIEGNARLLGDQYLGVLKVYAKEEDWRIRAAIARAARFPSPPRGLELLALLVEDPDRRVRLAVLQGLARHGSAPRAMDLAIRLLNESDEAMREAAATTLGTIGNPKAVPALRDALQASRASSFADARIAIIDALSKLAPGDPTTPGLFEEALLDPYNRVRRAAWKALSARGDGRAIPTLQLADEGREVALPGREYPLELLSRKPRIKLETTKGVIILELAPEDAPTHCWNLLHFVRKGAYDGRLFHRVVPNFVVQGGDARGDGYGNVAWWGGTLRLEVSMRTFDAHALGMPRGSDLDSGGDQIFITTVPTPHLDGRYTCFGRVVEGFSALLALEIGDRIERATEL